MFYAFLCVNERTAGSSCCACYFTYVTCVVLVLTSRAVVQMVFFQKWQPLTQVLDHALLLVLASACSQELVLVLNELVTC
jgi:hypothetical protein